MFGDADCRTAFVVTGNEFIARGVLGDAEDRYMTFCDPDAEFVTSLGLTHLPALVHLRQDTTLLDAAEGWDPHTWQRVVEGDRQGAQVVASGGRPATATLPPTRDGPSDLGKRPLARPANAQMHKFPPWRAAI